MLTVILMAWDFFLLCIVMKPSTCLYHRELWDDNQNNCLLLLHTGYVLLRSHLRMKVLMAHHGPAVHLTHVLGNFYEFGDLQSFDQCSP